MNIRNSLQTLALSAALVAPCLALATPPPWAPAHGWRKKHDPYYAGYSGRQYEADYGISRGNCNRDEIGAVLGGVAGGVIGAEIGRRMDDRDRSCIGQALELATANQTVTWSNPQERVSYQLTPLGANERRDDGCRTFKLVAHGAFGLSEGRTTACVDEQGVWRPSPDVQVSNSNR